VIAFLIDDADIDIGFGTGLHGLKDLVQKGLVAQLLHGMGLSNGDQLGHPFIKKEVDGTPPVFRQRFEILKDFG
jgi:hypothetical protein